ncbi:MAG: tRNA (adenosine(37)-N6)-threonylcarbamoyltransferase complex dimerization subunit type 1 TsaB [Hyphomicrobiaceae bacterium]
MKLNVLAIDTSFEACSAAVVAGQDGGERAARTYEVLSKGHAERIMSMVRSVVGEAGLGFTQIDRIAVTVGPGSFTGVRIGMAAAKGLALATSKELVGQTSLAVMAARYRREHPQCEELKPLAVVVDARRGQVYMQQFASGSDRGTGPVICAPDDAALVLPHGSLVVGSGAHLVAAAAMTHGRGLQVDCGELQPDAYDLAILARAMPAPDRPVAPLYLRAPDAKAQVGKAVTRAC